MIKIKDLNLEKLRINKSKSAIAAELKISRQSYDRLLKKGIGGLKLEELPLFVKVFDLSINDILEIDGKGISEIEKIIMTARQLRIKEQFEDLRSLILEHESFILKNFKGTKYNKELYIYKAVIELNKETPVAAANIQLAEAFFEKVKLIKTDDYLTESIFFRESAGLQALGYQNLEKASEFLTKALELFEKIPEKVTEQHADLHIAFLANQYHLLSKLKQHEQSTNILEQLFKVSIESAHLHRLGNAWYFKVLDCLTQHDPNQAEKYLNYARIYAEFTSNTRRMTTINSLYKMLDLAQMGVYDYNGKALNTYSLNDFDAIYREHLSDLSFKKRLLNFHKHRLKMKFTRIEERIKSE